MTPEMPVPAYSHCMAALNETSVMVIGGYSNGTACSQDTYILNTLAGTWVEGPPLNVGRVDHSCGSIRTSAVNFVNYRLRRKLKITKIDNCKLASF